MPPMTAADERHPRPALPAPPAGEDRAHDHHALEADVDRAAALGEQAGEAGEGDRHGGAEHHAERAARGEVVVVGDEPGRRHDGDGRAARATISRLRRRQLTAIDARALPAAPVRRATVMPRTSVGQRPRSAAISVRRPSSAAAASSFRRSHDLVGDDGGEQERALQDQADLLRDAEQRQPLRRPLDRRPHDRGGGDADRDGCGRAARCAMPVKPSVFGNWSPYLPNCGSASRSPCRSGRRRRPTG